MSNEVIEKIKALPDHSGLYLAGWKHAKGLITPSAEPTDLTTDDLKSLIAEAERRERVLREALEHYADESNWRAVLSDETVLDWYDPDPTNATTSGYEVAQQALKESE